MGIKECNVLRQCADGEREKDGKAQERAASRAKPAVCVC